MVKRRGRGSASRPTTRPIARLPLSSMEECGRARMVWGDRSLLPRVAASRISDRGVTCGRRSSRASMEWNGRRATAQLRNCSVEWIQTVRCLCMEFDASLGYDCELRSRTALGQRLERRTAAANLRSGYRTRHLGQRDRESLWAGQTPVVLIIGGMCAGKTTFGRRVSESHRWLHVEASDELRSVAEEEGIGLKADEFARARHVLDHMGPDVVARSIARKYHERLEKGAAITGFRTIEEVLYFRKRYASCVVVYVDAGERLRFLRHCERGRDGVDKTVDDFRIRDRRQWEFGLLERVNGIVDVPRDVADLRIENEGTLEDYYSQIDGLAGVWCSLGGSEEAYAGGCDAAGGSGLRVEAVEGGRAFLCLQALCRFGGPATCAEIREEMVGPQKESMIGDRHVNWTLANVPRLAGQVTGGGKLRYQILPAGRAYVAAVTCRPQ